MKKLTGFLLIALLLFCYAGVGQAQDTDTDVHTVTININDIAIIDLEGGDITLALTAPDDAGDDPVYDEDATCYLNYTSVVASGAEKKITAQITTGTVPAGADLKLTAAPAAGEGTSGGQVTLDDLAAKNVITAIGSCATGTGANDGAQLTYRLDVEDVTALLASTNNDVDVTYTITNGP